MSLPRIVSTVEYDAETGWPHIARVLNGRGLGLIGLVRLLLRESRTAEVAVLDGSSGIGRDLPIAGILRLAGRPARVVVVDATWQAGTGWRRTVRRYGFKAFDSYRVSYGVLTRAECETFPRTWGIEPGRVFHLPWYVKIPPEERALKSTHRVVFAGGDSLRDFDTLLAAAAGADFELQIASRTLPPAAATGLSNVVVRSRSHDEFVQDFRAAAVVVVPLEARPDRSAGQQTYLRAMAMGVPVVVSDVLGVDEHIKHGRTGWLVPPANPQALRTQLQWILDPSNESEVLAVVQAAVIAADRFSPQGCVDTLCQWIEGIS